MPLPDRLILLRRMSARIYVGACARISFLFNAEEHAIVGTDHMGLAML